MKPICCIMITKKNEILFRSISMKPCWESDMYNYHNTAITVCIDKSINGIISGRLLCPILPRPHHFTDVGSMLLQMEEMLDTIGYPCAFQRLRSFNDEPPKYSKPNYAEKVIPILPEQKKGELLTATVRIISRQNASWQGVAEIEDGRVFKFQSCLVFLKLLVSEFERTNAALDLKENSEKRHPMMA